MKIEFDPAKRSETLVKRGLDMADAWLVFAEPHKTFEDDRADYGEVRFISVGHLDGRLICIAWTRRGHVRRIISMRKANDPEIARHAF